MAVAAPGREDQARLLGVGHHVRVAGLVAGEELGQRLPVVRGEADAGLHRLVGQPALLGVVTRQPGAGEAFAEEAQRQGVHGVQAVALVARLLRRPGVGAPRAQRHPGLFGQALGGFGEGQPSARIKKEKTSPPVEQAPKQCHRPRSASTVNEGVFS